MTLVGRNQPEIRLSNRIGPGMRSGLDGSGHALLASIKCAACDHHGAQQVFQLTGRWHFKIDASKHFNLKCGRVLSGKSAGLHQSSGSARLMRLFLDHDKASHGSLVGNHERITVEIISGLGGKTAPD